MITECSNIWVRSGGVWKNAAGAKVRSGGQWKDFKGIRSGDTWYTPSSAQPLFQFRGNFTSETSSSPIVMLRNDPAATGYYAEIWWVGGLVATVPFEEDGPVLSLGGTGGTDETDPTKTYEFKIYSSRKPDIASDNITGIEIHYINVGNFALIAMFPHLKDIWFYGNAASFNYYEVAMEWPQRSLDSDWVLLYFSFPEPAISAEYRETANRKGYKFVFEPEQVKTIYPIITGIKDAGYMPLHFALFDGDTLQAPLSGAEEFASATGSESFGEGFEGAGRRALSCATTTLRLADKANQLYQELTFSILIKQTEANSSYTGFLGGVIFGKATIGLGYACGWAPGVQSNRPAFEIYTGASAPVYGNSPMLPQRWYNIIARARVVGTLATMELWINGEKTVNSFTGGTSINYDDLIPASSHYITLGLVSQGRKNYFSGLMQDFVLWDKALPDGEINKIAAYYNT